MNFDNVVIPLSAVMGEDAMVGSGFLVQLDGNTYLTTVAHLATGALAQFDDWPHWANEINIQDEHKNILTKVPIFDEDDSGGKVPLFKYGRTTSDPHLLLDVILIPLAEGHLQAAKAETFKLPAATTARLGDEVVIAGCRDWPRVNTERYTLKGTSPNGEVLHIDPPSRKGESGGPLLTLSGGLLGVNFGSDNPDIPGVGLVINAALITMMATAINGYIEGMNYGDPVNQGHPA